jgi:hypothetical protein
MANVVGLPVRRTAETGPAGPLHAVEGVAGRAAMASCEDVRALCGEWVRVVPVEEVPDDTGLCQACQYGS